jgi:dTDP-4-dehydrorhamnose 3,5-epimerase-like enzyme
MMPMTPEFKPVQRVSDARGTITIFSMQDDIPFVSKRVFTLTDVPVGVERGGHGHKKCQQYLVALSGSWLIKIFSAHSQAELKLDKSSDGVLIPIGTYLTMHSLETESVLCVFASEEYDPDDYFYDRQELVP